MSSDPRSAADILFDNGIDETARKRTFNVLSLLALMRSLESALQARRYTAPTWPRRVATNFPVRPSHSRTLLSQAADATNFPSGENTTCDICLWWPVRRATGFVIDLGASPLLAGEDEGKGDHKKRVWSSEPDIRSSGVVRRRLSYLSWANRWAKT